MQLAHEFIKLPYSFDVERLKQEVLSFSETQWCPHPDGFEGNSSLPLVTVNGEINNAFIGEMQPTEALESAPYLKQVLASFGQVIGRSRLMRLAPGTEVPPHSDTNFHWFKRVRIHIPVITDDQVIFQCGDKSLNMKAGDAWIFDSWKYHEVHNNGKTLRVHLVIDTAGDADFWDMVADKGIAVDQASGMDTSPNFIPYVENQRDSILTESANGNIILNPGELDSISQHLLRTIGAIASNDKKEVAKIERIVNRLCRNWRSTWYLHGEAATGWQSYLLLRSQAYSALNAVDPDIEIDNGTSAKVALMYCLVLPLINEDLAPEEMKLSATTSDPKASPASTPGSSSAPTHALTPNKTTAPARNALCSCGSGKKFKHCHGQLN